ncbi:ABC transporter ATP-binding protein [Marinitoga lauensis]|uniref:ABC transporter ATP-binding protein n=1 Tax=Marinitoga lauensis TaxID=2201189 RepID=UPI00101186F0|nr:ABC transporter ATP-binding protein [Marinitoga lauensis]
MKELLKIENICKTYPNGVKANKNISFKLNVNEIIGLVGPNGAGKTTLIRQILKLLKPTSGNIIINDKVKKISYVPQMPVFFPSLTVEESIKIPLKFEGLNSKDINNKTENILQETGLTSIRKQYNYTLSGGQKKLIMIALAFSQDPDIVILDEPTSMVDIINKERIWNLIKKYKKNKGILLSSHDMNEIKILADKVIIITNGEIIYNGKIEEINRKVKTPVELNISVVNPKKLEKIIKDKNIIHMSKGNNYSLFFSELSEALSIIEKIKEYNDIQYLNIEYPSFEKGVYELVKNME